MVNSKNKSKICCLVCKKEFYSVYFLNHIKKCKIKKEKEILKWKNCIEFKDFIICPICNNKYKELNNSHLKMHKITLKKFDKIYGSKYRISEISIKNKNTLSNMTEETRIKLKKSHTLDGFIDKYGKREGTKRYKISLEKQKTCRTLSGYIKKLGKINGTKKYKEYMKNKHENCSKEGYIKNHGIKKYKERIQRIKKRSTISGFIERHGIKSGTKKYEEYCNKISKSNSKVPKEQKSDYKKYYQVVYRITRRNIRKYNIKRKKNNHIDHKFSILKGYQLNILPYIIAHKENLENLTINENCSKQGNCSIELKTLLKKVSTFNKKENKLMEMN